ncbi:hypothetical protein Sxan_39880 [Streptomyces xanthophaeus]|uniref:Uncharacterized protein n=1 Tax=Streptomyces xanthophaeus TaxID=67385 RepID=A0A919GZ73_9ACTN|nr:hypothetical protein Sxan_39880 [Streptomyces xanthophaeus]
MKSRQGGGDPASRRARRTSASPVPWYSHQSFATASASMVGCRGRSGTDFGPGLPVSGGGVGGGIGIGIGIGIRTGTGG